MSPQPSTRDIILAALREHGRMGAAEIADSVEGLRLSQVKACLTGTRKKRGTDVFRIARWDRQDGIGGREIPVYDVGPGEDAPRPKFGHKTRLEASRRYNRKNSAILRAQLRVKASRHAASPFDGLFTHPLRASQ